MTTNDIYEWLKEKSTITTASGLSYDIVKFKQAILLIEFLMEERDYWKNAYMETNNVP